MAIRYLSGINVDSNTLFVDDANNRVGIGTASPTQALDVTGRAYISSGASIGTTSTAGTGLTVNGSTVLLSFVEIQQGNLLYLYSSGNTYYSQIYQSGQNLILSPHSNVGIGTTSPSTKLEVVGGSVNTQIARFITADYPTHSVGLGVDAQSTYWGASIFQDDVKRFTVDSTGGILVGGNYQGSDAPANGAAIEGSVGIGTTSPSTKLDVIGTGVFGTMTTSRGSYSNGLSLQNNGGQATSLFLWQSGVASAHIGSPANSTSLHIVNSYNTGLITDPNAIVLDNTGNVGIGTTSPSSKLQSNTSSTYNSATPSGAIIASNLSGGNAIIDIGVDTSYLGYIQSRNILNTTAYNLLLNPIGGNVGIGTTSPNGALHVASSPQTRVVIENTGNDANGAGLIMTVRSSGTIVGNGGIYVDNSNNLILYNGGVYAGNERVRINNSGYVGINTTAPSSFLTVSPGGSGNAATFTSTANAINNYVGITLNAVTVSGVEWYGSEIRNINTNGSPGFLNPRLGFFTQNASTYLPADRTEKMSILGNGNVGIGTTSPGYKLDVTGDINFTSTLKFGGVNVIHGTFADIYANIRVIRNASTSVSDGMYIGYDNSGGASGHLRFFANGTNERMRIDASTGNVGIGTTSPAYKLDVSGTARVTSTLLGGGRISAATEYRLNDNSYSRVAILDGAGAFAGGYNFNINSDFPQHDSTGAVSAYYYHSAGYISLFTNSSQAAGTAASERLRITSAGNVGIGTTSPTTILAISQASPIVTINSSDASQFHGIEFRNGNTLDAFIKQLPQTSEFRISNGRGASWGGHITFYTDTVERMRIASTGATRLNAYGSGSFTGTVAYNLAVDSSGNIIETAGGVVDGSGTANYVSKWSDANTLTISQLFDNGTDVGIGTSSPFVKFDVRGEAMLLYRPAGNAYAIYSAANNTYSWQLGINNGSDFIITGGGFTGLGTERLRITSDGNVGIGTTSPSEKLDVYGAIKLSGQVANVVTNGIVHHTNGYVYFTGGTAGAAMGNDSYSSAIYAVDNGSLELYAGSSNRLHITSAGNVGIGTTTPAQKLHVVGNTTITGVTYTDVVQTYSGASIDFRHQDASVVMRVDTANARVGIGTTSPGAKLEVFDGDISVTTGGTFSFLNLNRNFIPNSSGVLLGGTKFRGYSTGTTYQSGVHIYGYSNEAWTSTSSPGYLSIQTTPSGSTTPVERMVVTSAGNVGIGTTSPAYKLDVAGTISNNSEQNFIYATYDDVAALFQRVGTFGSVIRIGRKGVSNSTTIDYPADGTFAVSTAGLERLRITSAGNVGIGTTSPQVKLEVRGAQDNTIVPANAVAKFVGGDAGIFVGNLAGTPNYGAWLQAMRESDGLVFPLHLQPNGGNVGIGTTSPVTTLQVNATSPAIRLQETGSGGDKRLDLSVNSSGVATIAANQSAQVLTFETVGSERMRITNAGNIFFNATSAVSFETFGVAHQWSRFYTTSSTDYALVDVGNATTRVRIGVDSSTGGSLATGTSAYASYVGSSGSYPLQLGSYGGVAITINSSNNVGIGTTSPSTNLHVAGSVRVSGNSTNRLDLDGGVRITGQYYANSNTEYTYIDMYNNANASINIGTKHPLSYISFESGSGAYTERMRITNTGNVGIGTTAPGARLEVVAGNTTSISVRSGNSGQYSILSVGRTSSDIIMASAASSGQFWTGSVAGDGWIGSTNGTLSLGNDTTGVANLTIKSGNVGIGTTSPANKLVAVADATFNGENSYAIAAASSTDVAYKTVVGYDYANDVGVISAVRTGIQWKNLSILPVGNTNLGVGTLSPSQRLHVSGNIRVTGAYYDSNNSAGSSGQVLSSTGSGTDWVSLSEITGVDGTGTANYVAKWSDTDTITNSQIRDDGTTVGIGQAPAAAKLTVNGAGNIGGRYLYHNFQEYLDTTGINVAGLSASSNGDSAFFTFEAGAGSGHYQRIVYSCYNAAGTWNVVKVIDEGTNVFDVVASASSGSTITFTWKTRSGTIYYTPRLIITGVGSINTSYL